MSRTSAGQGHRRWTVVVPRAVSARRQPVSVPDEVDDDVRVYPQTTFISMVAACAAGLFLYGEKHHTASLDTEIGKAYQATQTAHDRTGILHAEWALLNSPDRLQQMTDQYLSLHPMSAGQYVQLSDLHKHLPDAVSTPDAADDSDELALYTVRTNERPAMALTAADPAVGGDQVAAADTGTAVPGLAADTAPSVPALREAAPHAAATGAAAAALALQQAAAPARAKLPRIMIPEDPAPVQVAASQPAPTAAAVTPKAAHPRIAIAQADADPAARPATPIVKAPSEAYRIMARAGARHAELVSAPASPAARPAETAPDDVLPRLRERFLPHAASPEMLAAPTLSRRLAVQMALASQRVPSWAVAHEDARLRPAHQAVLLRPELVHELLLPRPYAPTQAARPHLASVTPLPALRQRHFGQARSEPPHDLLLPAHPAPASSAVEMDPQDREERSASREEDERIHEAQNERRRYANPYPYQQYGAPYGYYAPFNQGPYGQAYAPYPQYQ